jgi:hypothetical protein
MSITVTDLKSELSERNYRMLTQEDDSIAERALTKAKGWVLSRFRAYGEDPSWEDDIVREATLKRALYELYAYAENEKVAADKRQDAIDLLGGILGRNADDADGGKVATGSVKSGEKPELFDNWDNLPGKYWY